MGSDWKEQLALYSMQNFPEEHISESLPKTSAKSGKHPRNTNNSTRKQNDTRTHRKKAVVEATDWSRKMSQAIVGDDSLALDIARWPIFLGKLSIIERDNYSKSVYIYALRHVLGPNRAALIEGQQAEAMVTGDIKDLCLDRPNNSIVLVRLAEFKYRKNAENKRAHRFSKAIEAVFPSLPARIGDT